MVHHLPTLTFVFEHICCLRKGHAHPAAGKGMDGFDACHPSKLIISMNRDLAGVDVHSMCVLEDIYPTRANLLPTGDCFPIWMNTLHPIHLQPYAIHHVNTQTVSYTHLTLPTIYSV